MKLTDKTEQLILNLIMVLIADITVVNSKHLISWLKLIHKKGTYTESDRNYLNTLRSKYLDNLKIYYIPKPTISQEPNVVNVQVVGDNYGETYTIFNSCGEIIPNNTEPLITKEFIV